MILILQISIIVTNIFTNTFISECLISKCVQGRVFCHIFYSETYIFMLDTNADTVWMGRYLYIQFMKFSALWFLIFFYKNFHFWAYHARAEHFQKKISCACVWGGFRFRYNSWELGLCISSRSHVLKWNWTVHVQFWRVVN